jgi:penicillin-binding protein 2
MSLVMEDGIWRINWAETLIMPELGGGNYLRMDWDIPVRAGIYDRNGNPLAAQTEAVAIGLYPDYVDLEEDNGLIGLLSSLTNYQSHTIYALAEDAEPGTYLALGEIPADKDPRRLDILRTYGAAVTEDYSSRLYYGDGIGPHVTGYVSAIQEDELREYRRLGYQGNERIGRRGIEAWGNEILSGVHGGTLYVFDPEGKIIGQLGSAQSQPGKEIFTTLDGEFQYRVQKAMSGFSGAAVVLERDTGRVLAMVSTPGFDPNAFEIENFNWSTLLNEIVNNPNSPQFNRATQGQYPLGSVFKIITLAAAMEQGGYTTDHTYDCQYEFNELQGLTLYDWTYDHFLEDGTTQPSGLLTLPEGLIRSCNPYFWHMGLDLYNRNLTTAISDMAKGFGLGSKTGIEGVDEEAGNIPEPQSQVDATNLAIGQGDTQVTPLQVARIAAAIGNGGTLYRPQVIERIEPPFGEAEMQFKPEAQGVLPVSRNTLKVLQDAMLGVVRSRQPAGTAYSAFAGLEINVAGKTGTATTGAEEPHAWFAGYTLEGREDKPDIAIAVIAENAGEGSEIAAPIFRRIVEEYFYGAPRKKYRWEAIIDVTKSPTLPITETPTPRP